MRGHAFLTGFFLLISNAAYADALETCYGQASNSTAVDECLTRYLKGAEKRMHAAFNITMQKSEIYDHQHEGSIARSTVIDAQKGWEQYTYSKCELTRIYSGSGDGSKHFQLACLIDEHDKRTLELEGLNSF